MSTELPFKVALTGRPYAFVSYAHADAARVYPITGQLHREGYELWYDEGIEPTDEWADTIPTMIDGSNLFIVFGSAVAYLRKGVKMEVDWASRHGANFMVVKLDAAVPKALDFLSGVEQTVDLVKLSQGALFTKLRDTLERYGISPTLRRAPSVSAPAPVKPKAGMPRRQRSRSHHAVADTFADRVPESEALRKSVEHQLSRLRGEVAVVDGVFPNVLVFHGQGGRGKTGMSKRMENWVTGALPEPNEWGPWPHPGITTVRWDFHDLEGRSPIRDMLLALRRSLVAPTRRWLALDLAMALYFEAVRGSDGDLGLYGAVADEMLRSLQVIAGRLGMGVPASLTANAVRQIAYAIELSGRQLELFHQYDGLGDLLDDITRIPDGSQGIDVAEGLLYLLTQEIFFVASEERPAVVVFIDPFEKIERHGNHTLEATIASFIAQLPYALFVVTGRNRLNWADHRRTDLSQAGPVPWPGLTDGDGEDPRQHLLGKLSDRDVRAIYEQARAGAGWDLSDELVSELVARADGLPLHLDAVLALLHNLERAQPGRTYLLEDLGGELSQVVVQLLDVLSADEVQAFRAACVLPSFDIPLAAAVAGVGGGAVDRAIRYALVEENAGGSVYPYRVHDEIRRLVRLDRQSAGYWSDSDWQAAAERGMAEAVRRVREGHEAGSDSTQIEGIALALRLGYEWGIYFPGLAEIVNDGPSITALAPLVPVPDGEPQSAIEGLLAFVHALALPFPEAPDALRCIKPSHPEVSAYVDRWTVYRLRSESRYEEAIELMRAMVPTYPHDALTNHNQYAVTLRSARRFREAIAYETEHRPEILPRFRNVIDRFHGVTPDNRADVEYLALQSSRRFRLELVVTDLVNRARSEGVERQEVIDLLHRSIDTGQRTFQRQCLMVLAYLSLRRDTELNALLERVRVLQASYGSTAQTIPHLLALRALYNGTGSDAQRAFDAVPEKQRGASWIATEMWLEALGRPLPPMHTQWLIPPDQVRTNWLRIADGIIARAPE